MLENFKEVYQQSVTALTDYKSMTQIELAEGYLEGGPKKDAYLAAIVLRYWGIIEKLAYKDKAILSDEKDAYDWFMDALLYLITACPWRDPKSSMYNDPRAIEKGLNTCVKNGRANWYQASNRQKRKINHNISSLDALSEEFKDAFVPREFVFTAEDNSGYKHLVLKSFNSQKYLLALIVDVIVNDLSIEKCEERSDLITNIKKCIRTLPPNYSTMFAENYGLDPKQVEKSFSYIYNMSDNKLKQSIDTYISQLRMILKGEE